jgi:TonB family protein
MKAVSMRSIVLVSALLAVASPVFAQAAPVAPVAFAYYEFQVTKVAAIAKDSPWPQYPASLKAAKVEGEVLATFVVDSLGMVDTASFRVLKSTDTLFTAAVREALPKMRFEPALLAGKNVRQHVQVPFLFAMADK